MCFLTNNEKKDTSKTPKNMRNDNKKLILNKIVKQGPVSRAELSGISGLSKPTISSIIDELLDKNLITELEPRESSGGRRPIPIKFNSKAGYIIGVDIGGTNVKIGISNLGGNVVNKLKYPSDKFGTNKEAIKSIGNCIQDLIKKANINKEKIIYCGVAVPGITDNKKGKVRSAPAFRWEGVELKKILQKKIQLPIIIENDVNAAAYAEKIFGKGKEYENFILINIGTGIGTGILLNGQIYRGANNAAGEIGYTIIDTSWIYRQKKKDIENDFGCLESLAGAPAIKTKAEEKKFSKNKFNTKEVLKAAENEDKIALETLEEITDNLAAGIINSILILDPEIVFVSGGVSEIGDILLKPLKNKIKCSSPIKTDIEKAKLGAEASFWGSISLAIEKVEEEILI